MWVWLKRGLRRLLGGLRHGFFLQFFYAQPKSIPEWAYLVTFPSKHPKWDKICKRRAPVSLLYGSSPGKQIIICSTWFFVKSMVTVHWEYWFCFTQFRLRWNMTGFMVRSNGGLTFVYFCQLGETAWTYALYFLTSSEVARFEINVET